MPAPRAQDHTGPSKPQTEKGLFSPGYPSGSAAADMPVPESGVVALVSPVSARCRAVRLLTAEILALAGDRVQLRRDRRRFSCHVRQISMYICHVVLQVSLTDIGLAFGRDRTTVGHACKVVEDRRDDIAFDDFVSVIERVVTAAFSANAGKDHE